MIPKPAGVKAGDVILAHRGTGGGGSFPAEFTELGSVVGFASQAGQQIAYRIAGAAEPDEYDIGGHWVELAAYFGVDTSSPIADFVADTDRYFDRSPAESPSAVMPGDGCRIVRTVVRQSLTYGDEAGPPTGDGRTYTTRSAGGFYLCEMALADDAGVVTQQAGWIVGAVGLGASGTGADEEPPNTAGATGVASWANSPSAGVWTTFTVVLQPF